MERPPALWPHPGQHGNRRKFGGEGRKAPVALAALVSAIDDDYETHVLHHFF
jgi:hypothetical protein